MTHQVIFLSEALRREPADAAPYSVGAGDTALAPRGSPVSLTVALRYLAGRRAFKRSLRTISQNSD